MNPWLLGSLADSRRREIRRAAAASRARGGPSSGPPPAGADRRWPRMRRQVGYALVEAGLHLLATAGPASRG